LGCLIFGVCWAALFVFTNFGLALGDYAGSGVNRLSILFWFEIAVLVVGGWLFYRAEMKDGEV
jgi:hypothetical protein